MIQHKTDAGFSIVLAMGFVLVLSFTGLYLLEYMVPFSRNIKGIENASQAFYESYSGVEETLLSIYTGGIGTDYSKSFGGDKDYSYSVTSSGLIIPAAGEGTSELDSNWNKLSQSSPVSLIIGDDKFAGGSNSITLQVRVPDFDGDTVLNSLKSGTYDDLILWQVSSSDASLTSKNILDISSSTKLVSRNIFTDIGLELGDATNATGISLATFYNNECLSGSECVLKISLINTIISPNDSIYPYLEYRIVSSDSIPLSHAYIVSRGKSFGFSKTLELHSPQDSTNAAFDFTVLQ